MCRHCDRIKEDLDSKPIVHAFMADIAAKMSRNTGVDLTADDLDLRIEIMDRKKMRAALDRKLAGLPGKDGRPIPGTVEYGEMPNDAGMQLASRAHRMIHEAFGIVGG